MSSIEIHSKVQELRELRRMAEELQTEIDTITDTIKQHMTATNADELNGTDYKITWKAVTSARIDTAALKKAMPDVAEAFTKASTARRFILA